MNPPPPQTTTSSKKNEEKETKQLKKQRVLFTTYNLGKKMRLYYMYVCVM